LITDERSRQAVETAERFAARKVGSCELSNARHLARVAVCEAKRAEWVAEAEANFKVTADYCVRLVKLFAACAAMAAASQKASDAHGGWECYQDPEMTDPPRWLDPPRGSQYWAAAAVGQLRQQEVLASGLFDDSVPIVSVERTAWLEECLTSWQMTWQSYLLKVNAEAAREAVRADEVSRQAELLREIFGNPFR
jgi:hypothetical protein